MAIKIAFAFIEIQLQRQYGLLSKFADDSWEGRESPKYEAPVNMKSGLNIAQQYLGDKSTRAFFFCRILEKKLPSQSGTAI